MAQKLLVCLLLPITLISCTAHQTQHGFFTGSRAAIVELLRQANGQGIRTDESIALALQAKAKNEGKEDPCLDYLIHSSLARYYLKIGDQKSASLYAATSLDDMASLLLDPGIAQGFYEIWLLSYDARISIMDIGSDEATVSLLRQFDSLMEELNETRAELGPEEAAAFNRLKKFASDVETGSVNRDVSKLKRARHEVSKLFTEMTNLTEEPEEKELLMATSDLMRYALTLEIAEIERDRREYERAARQAATLVNRMLLAENE